MSVVRAVTVMRDFVIDDKPSPSAPPGNEHPAGDVMFSQVARLELDDLLEQLLLRVRDVQGAQGRLRGLLRAFLAVARADSLDAVLRHVVEAARELVDAGYAALGLVSDGRLTRFVHTGMDADVVTMVGHLPDGKGLLGLLVDHHPPTRSFLGVPIQVGDRILGNLYLTEKQNAEEFTGDDEQLVQALAAAAGAAIENATLLSESRRRHTWQTAMVEVSTQLLAGTDTDEVLQQLVHHARETLRGVTANVSIPTDDPEQLHLAVTDGDQTRQGSLIPATNSVSGAAITAGKLIVVRDPINDPRTTATADHVDGPIGETVAVPLIGADDSIIGVLTVSRAPDAEPFDQLDLDLVTAVAAHAGLALHLSRARADAEQLRLLGDRQQIGEDLRHHVIHRLFRHGLALQFAGSRSTDPLTRGAVQTQIDEVDAIIHDIRTAVFALNPAWPAPTDDTPTGPDPAPSAKTSPSTPPALSR